MGVGVNTGPAVVGNMGSSLRFDYTAMGDTVNLASRLESITKAYGVSMLVSESTRSEAEHAFLFRTIDRLKVKGKSQAVTVHEVLAPRVGDEKIPLWASQYEDALRAMTARHWDEAETLLDSVLAEKPGDGPAKLLIARISDYRLTPPPSSWDGAWAWETK